MKLEITSPNGTVTFVEIPNDSKIKNVSEDYCIINDLSTYSSIIFDKGDEVQLRIA